MLLLSLCFVRSAHDHSNFILKAWKQLRHTRTNAYVTRVTCYFCRSALWGRHTAYITADSSQKWRGWCVVDSRWNTNNRKTLRLGVWHEGGRATYFSSSTGLGQDRRACSCRDCWFSEDLDGAFEAIVHHWSVAAILKQACGQVLQFGDLFRSITKRLPAEETVAPLSMINSCPHQHCMFHNLQRTAETYFNAEMCQTPYWLYERGNHYLHWSNKHFAW